MYRLEREDFVRPRYVSLWTTLAFQAGYLNALGFIACGRYISHVTGVGTQLGMGLANQKYFFVLELAGFPLFFILGSFVSGALTIARIERGKRPHFEWVTTLLPIALGLLLVAGEWGAFGVFGEELLLPRDFALLYSLTFLAGMQNGCFATLTKGQIRTTHLTGISTDIGTDLARLLIGKITGRERQLTQMTNLSRILTFLGFTIGSIVSVLLTDRLQYSSLAIPIGTAVISALTVRSISRELDQKQKAFVLPNQIPLQKHGV